MQTDTPSQERDTELSTDLVAHLREEADFNRSWIDGRRRAYASDAVGYAARRKAFADRADNWADEITRLRKELEAAREALTDIAVYGCGMLNQPAAMNGPEEAWLRKRISEYERVARAALGEGQ